MHRQTTILIRLDKAAIAIIRAGRHSISTKDMNASSQSEAQMVRRCKNQIVILYAGTKYARR